MNKDLEKEFDIVASSLGLDGEQMDEMRDLFRKAYKAGQQSKEGEIELCQKKLRKYARCSRTGQK